MDRYLQTNGLQLHYLDHTGTGPTLICLPGLTANAHAFDGLIAAGLSPRHRVLAFDLRGRGLSDKPAVGYTMAEHAADVIGALDALGLASVVCCGHSFGGLLTLYLAAHYPARIAKLVVLDAAAGITNPQVREQLKPSLARLGQRVASWEAYLDAVKRAPFFLDWWEPLIENYYRADVEVFADGSVQARARPENIAAALDGAEAEDWRAHLARITQPALLLHSRGPFGWPGAPPLVEEKFVAATVAALADARARAVPGNHLTMLFGAGAPRIVECIAEFV